MEGDRGERGRGDVQMHGQAIAFQKRSQGKHWMRGVSHSEVVVEVGRGLASSWGAACVWSGVVDMVLMRWWI